MPLIVRPEVRRYNVPEGRAYVVCTAELIAQMADDLDCDIVTWGDPVQPPSQGEFYEPVFRQRYCKVDRLVKTKAP